jgi:hypothetical protein
LGTVAGAVAGAVVGPVAGAVLGTVAGAVVGAVALHMQMAVRLWRLTAERSVQFGLTSCEFGGPEEVPFHSFHAFPQPITIPRLFQP